MLSNQQFDDFFPPAPDGASNIKWQIYEDPVSLITSISGYTEGGSGNTSITVFQYVATDAGAFVFNHGLGTVPSAVTFTMTNTNTLGQFWLDTTDVPLGYDAENVYGISSDVDISGQIIIFG